jgi:nucleoside-diphosphate-sugar epimerase
MTITIIGASGFIGGALARFLKQSGATLFTPARGDEAIFELPLGQVFYCAGVTADFRSRPFATMDAHMSLLSEILRRASFDSLLYLSSTRVYRNARTATEDSRIEVDPGEAESLYDLSKLAGESLCLHGGRKGVRIVRLSNVYGPGMGSKTFLAAVLGEGAENGEVVFRSAPDSARDFIALDEVIHLLPRIAQNGAAPIYNLASGHNITNREIAEILTRITDWRTTFAPAATRTAFPTIDISRIKAEFGFQPTQLVKQLPDLMKLYRGQQHALEHSPKDARRPAPPPGHPQGILAMGGRVGERAQNRFQLSKQRTRWMKGNRP